VEDLSDMAYIDLYGDETADDDLNSHNNESKKHLASATDNI